MKARRSTRKSPKPIGLPDQPADDAPLAEWAAWCADVGRITGAWKVFRCRRKDKRPSRSGWQRHATNDPEKIKKFWEAEPDNNIGLAIQPGFVAVDVDDWEVFEKLEGDHGELPATFEQRTANGGGHFIFATELDTGNSTGSLPKGIDIRGHGGYIVGAGSVLDGDRRWTVEAVHIPSHLPEWFAGYLTERKASKGTASKPILPAQGVVIDHPRNIKDYTNWCRGKSVRTIATPEGEVAAPCIEGQRGNNMLAATGAVALDYGLSDDVALEVALEHFNPRCEPPWDEDDFERHFCSGYRSAWANGGQLGSRAPARDTSTLFKPVRLATVNGEPVSDPDARYRKLVRYFEGVLAASGERERQGKRFSDIAPFGERTGASWAIEKWLLKNATNALFGESEAFKTYVTIYLLLCVATGTPCFAYEEFEGCPVDGPRDAILFAGEGYDDVLDRIDAAIEGGGFDRKLVEKHLIIVGDVYALNWANGLAAMADEIEALDAHPAIIAVDTYNLALDGNEDSSDEAKRALRGLRALATMFDAAGLVLHHPGWGDTKRPRGSSAFRANADVMILCERAPGDAKMASLTQYKNRSADKTKYRAALVGEPVDLGVDVDTGETISNLSFSPITPSAVPSARDDSGLRKIGMANLYAEGLAQVLLDADDPTLGPSAAAQALREWLVSQDHKAPTANTLRKHFLYAVRDAIEGEPEYAAAYLIHSREKLMFSHPDRINGIKRAPRVTAEGFSRVTESDAKR